MTALSKERESEISQWEAFADAVSKGSAIDHLSLSGFHSPRLPPDMFSSKVNLAQSLVALDLSRNEIKELPIEIGSLNLLKTLNVSRNFLRKLPAELGQLVKLVALNASSNDLRMATLQLDILTTLPELKSVDLQHNNAICEPAHLAQLANQMGGLGIDCPITLRAAKAEKLHAADRDATQLRSQLTPHSTGTLRRRLALVFGETTDPELVDREGVMTKLLSHYERMGPRQIRRIQGLPVPQDTCDALLKELDRWSESDLNRTTPRERLNVRAQHYMILTSPAGFANPEGLKALRAKDKLTAHMPLWELARKVAEEADPEFATRYTAVAFTKNFQGSPHIDTQNIATFRGLALGDFSEGGGALAVECSANEVAWVDTRNRLGKVDGRYPHWVAPYTGTRYSVIYYQTRGDVELRTTAVFEGEPLVHEPTTYCRPEDKYYNKYNRETNTYNPST